LFSWPGIAVFVKAVKGTPASEKAGVHV